MRCDGCEVEFGVHYATSPFPHVGGFWLCPPCREAWLTVQEAPSLDRTEPRIEPRLRAVLIRRVAAGQLWTRPVYTVERSPP